MIIIKNSQKKIKVDLKKIESWIDQILKILKYDIFDVSLWLTTNATIRKFNKNFRKKDKPTDILSFPYYPDLKPGERIKLEVGPQELKNKKLVNVQLGDDANLGDIIISLEYAKKYADQNNINFDQHIKVLLVHGLCHLIGYDHETDKDYELMSKKEASLLKKLY